jgi:hypothetical protein
VIVAALDVIEGYQKANAKRLNERMRRTVPAREGFVPKISDFLGFFSIQRGEGPAFSDLLYLLVVNVLAITKPILSFARSPNFPHQKRRHSAAKLFEPTFLHSLAEKGGTAYPQKPPIWGKGNTVGRDFI